MSAFAGLAMAGIGRPGFASSTPHRRAIDVHHHFFPPQYFAEGPPQVKIASGASWTPAKAVDAMDRAGVDLSILSFPSPYLWFPGIENGRRLARMCNEYGAQVVRDGRNRFALFAGLPALDDTAGCLREIAFGLDVLGAPGVAVMTSYGDKWLGHSSFAPVWDELNNRGAVVFVHPSIAVCCGALPTGVPYNYLELPFETARAIASLWYSGALVRWPKINFIFSHGGGPLPMIADRLSRFGRPGASKGETLFDGRAAFRKLYFDTANAASSPALDAARMLAAPRHLLYGSDFPYIPIDRETNDLAKANISARELREIERDNALLLMPNLPIGRA
jgi:6-methylsalicylate decarboxylase